jgi:hypothetical protein
MVGTALGGSATTTAAGAATITISPQHDFEADDIRFDGLAGSTVSEIRFGDTPVWSGENVGIAFFGNTSFLKGTLKGAKLKGGFDIRISVQLPAAGTVSALITGKKPATCN